MREDAVLEGGVEVEGDGSEGCVLVGGGGRRGEAGGGWARTAETEAGVVEEEVGG